jgi:hypothetical protein
LIIPWLIGDTAPTGDCVSIISCLIGDTAPTGDCVSIIPCLLRPIAHMKKSLTAFYLPSFFPCFLFLPFHLLFPYSFFVFFLYFLVYLSLLSCLTTFWLFTLFLCVTISLFLPLLSLLLSLEMQILQNPCNLGVKWRPLPHGSCDTDSYLVA